MKKYSIIFFFSMVTFSSCKKFLEEIPKDQITNANFYKTEEDIEASVDGIYNAARFEAAQGLPIMFPLESMSDDGAYYPINRVAEREDIDKMQYTTASTLISGAWNRSYNVINRANNTIKYAVDSVNIKPRVIRLAQAQARFFRAMYHFRLTQIYGDIPLMMQPADVTAGNIFPRKTSTRIIYDSVINDLIYAKANLDTSYGYATANGGRVTVAAAKTLLGKVYLTMAGFPLNDVRGYQLAIEELNDLIVNKNRYNIDLNPTFANIFTPNVATKQLDKERIYFIRGTSGLPQSLSAFTGMGWTFRTFKYTSPTKDFATDAIASRRVYETGDLRRAVTVNSFTNATVGSSLVAKYNSTNQTDASDDLILLRYADVLMMTAEALIEIGGTANLDQALTYINLVRRTHGGAPSGNPVGTVMPALTYTNQADLKTKYRLERRREFAFECHRWFDLKRWDILIPTIQASLADDLNRPLSDFNFLNDPIYPNKYKVLPIPLSEISNNSNMSQNDGY